MAFLGIALALIGVTLLNWSVGAHGNNVPLNGSAFGVSLQNSFQFGLGASLFGLCLLANEPKNVWLLLGPVILLDLVRVASEEHHALHGAMSKRYRAPARASTAPRINWRTRSGRTLAVLVVPVATLGAIGYASPFVSLHFHEVCEVFCLLLSFVGVAIRMLAAGRLPNSSDGRDGYAKPLITDGIFSVVRYPRYLGDYFIGLGVVLIPFVWWLPVLYTFAFGVYYGRIVAIDDTCLRQQFGQRFDRWAAVTPALFPRLSQWRRSIPPLSFRTALKREHTAVVVVIALHSSVEWLEHLILERRVMLELFWLVLTILGLVAYLTVRHVEKHTRLLNAPMS
jgi:protein-S-isoprenylcysteine O-methyltransferase Ste14